MMEQLGITRLRPGPSGTPGATNSANYDPVKANPFPNLPDALTLKSGAKVTTAEDDIERAALLLLDERPHADVREEEDSDERHPQHREPDVDD